MQFDQIKNEVRTLKFDTLRMDCDNLFEAVVVKEELQILVNRLENFFGRPTWPSKERLSFKVRETVDNYGGIQPGQTLYFRNQQDGDLFAMLWPWLDGNHTTVKIIKK